MQEREKQDLKTREWNYRHWRCSEFLVRGRRNMREKEKKARAERRKGTNIREIQYGTGMTRKQENENRKTLAVL